MERLIKKYERNIFGNVSSLAGNTINKFASFSCIDMGTRALYVFSTLRTLDYGISTNILGNPCGFICDNKTGPLNISAKCLEIY